MPFGSPAAYDYYQRPVYSNMTFTNVKIPKDLQKKGKPREVTYEQMNSSVVYRRVPFTNPDEDLLLPASIETVQVYRSETGQSRLRITQTFAKYRRFVTDSRLIP